MPKCYSWGPGLPDLATCFQKPMQELQWLLTGILISSQVHLNIESLCAVPADMARILLQVLLEPLCQSDQLNAWIRIQPAEDTAQMQLHDDEAWLCIFQRPSTQKLLCSMAGKRPSALLASDPLHASIMQGCRREACCTPCHRVARSQHATGCWTATAPFLALRFVHTCNETFCRWDWTAAHRSQILPLSSCTGSCTFEGPPPQALQVAQIRTDLWGCFGHKSHSRCICQ